MEELSVALEDLQAQKLEAEIRKLTLESERNEVALATERRIAARKAASADEHKVYTFYDQVSVDSCYNAQGVLAEWSRSDPGCPITIVLTSPGGSVTDGLGLYDYILSLRSIGHYVTVVALGMAASMGGVLLQAGDRRVIGPNAFLLIHEASAGTYGKVTDMQEQLAFVGRLQGKCLDILASRSTISRQVIARRWKKMDWWLDAEEAVEGGFADEILSAGP